MFLKKIPAAIKIPVVTIIMFFLIFYNNVDAYMITFVTFFVLLILSRVNVLTILKICLYPILIVVFYLILLYVSDQGEEVIFQLGNFKITTSFLSAAWLMIMKVYTFTILSISIILTTRMSDVVNFVVNLCRRLHLDRFNIDIIINVAVVYINLLHTEFLKATQIRNIRVQGEDKLTRKFKDYANILLYTISNATAKSQSMAIALTFREK